MASETSSNRSAIMTGAGELDQKLGGGIPLGSLTLIEGQSNAGKSVLSQQLAFGSLRSSLRVAYYTTENTVKSLISQMNSLGLDIADYFMVDRLRIYPLAIKPEEVQPEVICQVLLAHISTLPEDFDCILVDSVTNLIMRSSETLALEFCTMCKTVCDMGRSIFLVAHTHAFNETLLTRVRSLCDAHLRLRTEEVGERLIKVLEVAKVRGAERNTGNIVSFDVEPGVGINIIPVSKAKA